MSDFAFIDIVFFAMVALFLILRLRAVLGKRTGNERPRGDPYSAPTVTKPTARGDSDNVIALPDRSGGEQPTGTIAAGVAQIRSADPQFNEQQFLGGARAAFEIIIGAFAAGDREALRPLLSDEVFENFAREIDRREKAREHLETTIVRIRSVDVVEARMDGRNAIVVVKFVSEQINTLRDEKGDALPDQSTAPAEVIDIWTFARNTRSGDPTWTLVATGTAH